MNGAIPGKLKSRRGHAFTLIELLVSMAVFSVICLILLSLISNTSLVTTSLQGTMERNSELRGALNWLSADFRNSILRDDLAPIFIESAGNDEIYFHVAADGYDGDRGITFVGYRIREGHLERGAQGTDWSSNPIPFSENLESHAFVVDPQNVAYDILGQRIFRMETEFFMKDGTFLNELAPGEWKNVAAIAVTLATIDQRSLEKSTATPEQFEALFPDPESGAEVGTMEPIVKQWSQLLMDAEFLSGDADIPAEARRGIQVRHRLFPINNE